jgi:hypothetical protein
MFTIETIIGYMERTIARDRLAGDKESLRRIQVAAGTIMHAAEEAGDKGMALRFRVLAAQAANKREEVEDE